MHSGDNSKPPKTSRLRKAGPEVIASPLPSWSHRQSENLHASCAAPPFGHTRYVFSTPPSSDEQVANEAVYRGVVTQFFSGLQGLSWVIGSDNVCAFDWRVWFVYLFVSLGRQSLLYRCYWILGLCVWVLWDVLFHVTMRTFVLLFVCVQHFNLLISLARLMHFVVCSSNKFVRCWFVDQFVCLFGMFLFWYVFVAGKNSVNVSVLQFVCPLFF